MRFKMMPSVILALALAVPSAVFAEGTWTTNAPVPSGFGREGACVTGSGGDSFLIYIIAGFGPSGDSNTNTAYDPVSNSYTTGLAPRPGSANSEGVGVAHGGLVYCLGGRDDFSANDSYDPKSNSWTSLAPLLIPVAAEDSAVVVGDEIHIIGGRLPGAGVPFSAPKTDAHQVYDIPSNTWSSEPAIPGGPRSEMAAVAHGDRIYVIGGNAVPFGAAVTNVDIYDVARKTWSAGPPLPAPRANEIAGVIGNNIYVTGGLDMFLGPFHTETFKLDISKGVWSTVASKPTGTAETRGVVHGGQMFVIGGGFFGAGAGPLGEVNESFRR